MGLAVLVAMDLATRIYLCEAKESLQQHHWGSFECGGWTLSSSGMSAVGYLAWTVMIVNAVLVCYFPRPTASPNFSAQGCLAVVHDSLFSYWWWDELLPNQYFVEVLLRVRRMEFRPRHHRRRRKRSQRREESQPWSPGVRGGRVAFLPR